MADDELRAENRELRLRLEEAEETLRAIRRGDVDAFVVEEDDGHRVYTLQGADRPYRLLVEQMQQGAATLLADGSIVYCNLRLAELLLVPHAKVVGAALHDFVAPADRPAYDHLLEQGRGGSGRGEARLRRSDGELVHAYLTFNVLPSDSGAALGVLVTDLTAQRHHEQLAAAHAALQSSEATRRFAMQAAGAGSWTWDAASNTLTWSEETYELFGIDPKTPLFYQSWREALHPEDVDRTDGAALAAMEKGEDLAVEYRIRHPVRGERWLTSLGRIFDPVGRPGFMTGITMDITAGKRAQEHLRQLAADLSEAARRKDEFLAMLAHELRNPLAPIHNSVQILRLTANDTAAVHSAADMLERQVGQMVRLVDDLLDVSRISRGKIELRRARTDLSLLVQQAVEAARSGALCLGHELSVWLPPQPIFFDADPVRLAQVVGNLLNNACKFTPGDGRIEVTLELEGREAVLRVRDEGIGIATEQLPRIFEMFAQVDGSLERAQSGLGIGLTLVKKLVAMHGGSVEAHSDGVGLGSEFVVRLPGVVASATPDSPQPAERLSSPTSSRRVLVVDDNTDSATSLAMLLELEGHVTHVANDGLEAVEAAAAFEPDLILLDIGLPKLNGYEAARRIRQQPSGREPVLVALTGWGQEEDRRRSREAGFDRHMVKPVDYSSLRRLLETLARDGSEA
jgi:PAS domain S-box-containing protein